MRLFKLTTVLFVGMAMMLSACADKRGLRSRIPVVEPSIVDLAPASENAQPEETLDDVAPNTLPDTPQDQSLDVDNANSELSEPALIEETSEETNEEYADLSPLSEEAIAQSIEDQRAMLATAQNTIQQRQGLSPLSQVDREFTVQAAELFTAQILNQEVTPDLIQQSLSQNFNPALSKNIMGMSVRRIVQVAPADEASAGIYDVAVDFGLKWTDGATGASNVDHMVSTFQLQYPHQNGSGVVEASVAFAQELDSEDGGRVNNIVLYATCAAENCGELLILLRMLDPRPGFEGKENIAAYQFVENMADSEVMTIQSTSIGIDNFLSFEEVQEQILVTANDVEAAPEETSEAVSDDGSQPVDAMATQEESVEGQTVELETAEEETVEEETVEEAANEVTAETRTETVDRGNGIRTYKGGFIE